MITVVAFAHCQLPSCGWTAKGAWADVDRQAERHVKTTGHPAGTEARPA